MHRISSVEKASNLNQGGRERKRETTVTQLPSESKLNFASFGSRNLLSMLSNFDRMVLSLTILNVLKKKLHDKRTKNLCLQSCLQRHRFIIIPESKSTDALKFTSLFFNVNRKNLANNSKQTKINKFFYVINMNRPTCSRNLKPIHNKDESTCRK